MFEIEKNIPLPAQKDAQDLNDFLKKLEINDSFVCEKKYKSKLFNFSKSIGIKLKFVWNKEDESNLLMRVWRVG